MLVAVLAGGRGSRLGEPKALADLLGRPLISWPLAAAADSGLRTVVVAKPSTALPDLDVEVLLEPEQPQHPLAGLVRALEEGGPVIAVGCDMPFVTARVLTRLAGLEGNAVFDDQPFPGRYEPGAIGVLSAALGRGEPVREALRVLDPLRLRLPDALATASVNTPEQLAEARRLLG